MHTCRLGTDARNSGLAGRVATAIMGTEQNEERNDGFADLDQSLKDLEIDCTLKTVPAIGATSRFNTNKRMPRPARGGGRLNRAAGTAARGGTSSDGGGPETKKRFARGRSFGGYLACVVWVFLVSLFGGGVGVVQAAFKPADRAALKAAVGTCTRSGSWGSYTYSCTGGCLGETPDGSCPNFAASNGVIGDWDVSLVTDMEESTYTLSPPLQDQVFFGCFFFSFSFCGSTNSIFEQCSLLFFFQPIFILGLFFVAVWCSVFLC